MKQVETEKMLAEINTFLRRLAKKGIQVNISEENKKEITQRRHKKGLSRFLNNLGDSIRLIRTKTGIDKFLILCDEKNSTPIQLVSEKPGMINLAQITPGTSRYKEVVNRAIKEAKRIKKGPEIIKVEETPKEKPISMAVKPVEPEEVSPKELLELGKGVKIYLSPIKDLGIQWYRDENSPYPYIELSKGSIELPIWQWKAGDSKVIIGKQEYKIEEDVLVESKWDELNEVRKFPLMIGEKGEKIIDPREIKGNKELDRLLFP